VKATPWLDGVLGDRAAEFRTLVQDGIETGVDAAGSEYQASAYQKSQVYGVARDQYVMHEVAERLRQQFDAAMVQASGGRSYAAVDGLVIYPWCFANQPNVDPEKVPFDKISDIRRELFQNRQPLIWQRPLFELDAAARSETAAGLQLLEIELPAAHRDGLSGAVLLAYAASPSSGLLSIAAADVYLHDDGELEWHSRENLFPNDSPPDH
jgi:hypothetical protein